MFCPISLFFTPTEQKLPPTKFEKTPTEFWKRRRYFLKTPKLALQDSNASQFLLEIGWEISLDCRKLCVFSPRTFNTSDRLYCLSYLSFGLPFHQRVTRGCLCASMYLGAPIAVKASCTELWFKAYFLCNSGEGVEELCWMLSKEKPQYLVGVLRLEVIVGCCVCKPKRL